MPGEDYYVTFEWWSAIDRPLVVHLDLLDAKTKAWITGDEVEVRRSTGVGRRSSVDRVGFRFI